MLVLCFAVLTPLLFAAVMYATRPSPEITAAEARLHSLVATKAKVNGANTTQLPLEEKAPGTFFWLEQRLEGTEVLRRCQLLLLRSRSKWSAGELIVATVSLAWGVPLLVYLATGNVLLAIAGFAAGFVPTAWLQWKKQKRVRAFDAALPQSLEMFSRSLRAGHSIPVAIGILAEEAPLALRHDFVELHHDQNYGLPLREAFLAMLERIPSRDLHIFVTGVLIQKDTGGNLPDVMDRIVAVIRDRVRIQGEVRIHTAQGRLTGWILCLLPVILLLVINVMSPGYSRILLHDESGRKLLYAGVVLLAMGAITIHQIIRGIEV
ncbi:type II secretion system F family protein [Terriglobus sp. RCC_193]|uniref:type II secretion system F family protein n=1 Tax=Terriglobus sp. RCC_193 TaxID=3239218 RepID=UPI00352455DB